MNEKILEKLGLTQNEISIYICLLKLGSSKAGSIMYHCSLANSAAHLSLNKLVEKGLATFTKHGNIKHYTATDPKQLLGIINKTKIDLEKIIPELESLQTKTERQEAEVFEGLIGLKSMYYKLIEDSVANNEYLFFAFICNSSTENEEVSEFFKEFREIRMNRGLNIRGIIDERIKNLYLDKGWDKKNLKFVKYPTMTNIAICNNKTAIAAWDDRQVSFLITSKQIADMHRRHFNEIWNKN